MQRMAYDELGGEAGVLKLVRDFYDIVESDPDGAPLMELHNQGNGLAHARAAQFEFLSGLLGGPQLYVEHQGHSNVRRMHEHLKIGSAERDAWIRCMQKALRKQSIDPDVCTRLMSHFSRIAQALVNK